MTIEDLIDTITSWPVGMPVRAMEQLIAEGTAATPALAQTVSLADRFGDPDGLLQPVKSPIRAGRKVGRNELCPCGSGQKYKRCCAGKIH